MDGCRLIDDWQYKIIILIRRCELCQEEMELGQQDKAQELEEAWEEALEEEEDAWVARVLGSVAIASALLVELELHIKELFRAIRWYALNVAPK